MGAFRQEEGEASGDLKIAHLHLGLLDFDLDIAFASVEAMQPRHCHDRSRSSSQLFRVHRERPRGLQLRCQPIHGDVVALLMVSFNVVASSTGMQQCFGSRDLLVWRSAPNVCFGSKAEVSGGHRNVRSWG